MPPRDFRLMLQGGDRRSIGYSNRVAALVLEDPARFPELIECLWNPDPLVRMRAADSAEKVSAQRPDLLRPFQKELLNLAGETEESGLRWHLAQMIPRLRLQRPERDCAAAALRKFLQDRGSLVKTFAIQGLAELAREDADLHEEVVALLEKFCAQGTPAMKARSRKLLARLRGTR